MRVLAIETATPVLGCAVWDGEGPVASLAVMAGRRHSELLMPAVQDLLARAGLAAGDLEGLAVDRGPGLFTGLRVGLASAGALSQALGLPCAGVSSLDVLAQQHRRRTGLVAAMVDARRGEVFWALYQGDGTGVANLRAPEVASPAVVAEDLAGLDQPVLAVGDGAWRYRGTLAPAGLEVAEPTEIWPRPELVAELSLPVLRARRASVGTPAPLYLRQADVRIGWEQVGGRVEGPGQPLSPVR